jgi:hypothetical protein
VKPPAWFWAALACAFAVLAGLFIPAHGIYKVPPLDHYAPTSSIPAPEPSCPALNCWKDAHASSGAKAKSATPIWSEGWQFKYRDVCIESSIPGFPGAEVGAMYRKNGMNVYVRFALGQCAAAGFPVSQILPFEAYTAADLKTYGAYCAYTQPANYGDLTGVYVRVNVSGSRTTACGNYASGEWVDVFGHEAGHGFGLSHDQPYVSSIMRDGHTTSPTDIAYLGYIYSNNPHLILKH